MSEVYIHKAAAIFLDDKGRLMVSKDKGSTKWQMLGGAIEPGETQLECLKRELREELDVEIEVDPKMYRQTSPFAAANDPDKKVVLYLYYCKLLGEPKLIEHVEALHWLTKDDAQSGKFEFSEVMNKFILPLLIKEKILA